MATSTDTELRRTDRRRKPVPDTLARYDLTLLVVPLVFLCALVLGPVLSIPTPAALFGAALCGAVAVADALFLNPPTGGRS